MKDKSRTSVATTNANHRWIGWYALTLTLGFGSLTVASHLFGFTLYDIYAWCEQRLGGWFAPIALSLLIAPITLVPLLGGIVAGIREASTPQPRFTNDPTSSSTGSPASESSRSSSSS
ncbi:MAG: hypothetical protein AAF078_06490 [Planctomycetota bacterium]